MTDLRTRINETLEIVGKMTEGPWFQGRISDAEVFAGGDYANGGPPDHQLGLFDFGNTPEECSHNAQGIAHARNVIEVYAKALLRAMDALDGYAGCCDGCTCGDGWGHDSARAALADIEAVFKESNNA